MKELQIEFVRHKTAKGVVLAWYRHDHPRMKEENLLKMKCDFDLVIKDEKVRSGTVSQMISVVRSMGYWGYCAHVDKKVKQIHYWTGKKVNDTDVINFIAHEVSHAVGYKSESTACKVGGVAAFSYEVLKEYFSEYMNEKT